MLSSNSIQFLVLLVVQKIPASVDHLPGILSENCPGMDVSSTQSGVLFWSFDSGSSARMASYLPQRFFLASFTPFFNALV